MREMIGEHPEPISKRDRFRARIFLHAVFCRGWFFERSVAIVAEDSKRSIRVHAFADRAQFVHWSNVVSLWSHQKPSVCCFFGSRGDQRFPGICAAFNVGRIGCAAHSAR